MAMAGVLADARSGQGSNTARTLPFMEVDKHRVHRQACRVVMSFPTYNSFLKRLSSPRIE